ncbi:hypothetical protein [Candidatus Chloroploca asiatica]|uniref:Uncharacterized protein n=1 Tax=Candidatus Chloroploca asiatica TaxID=1506545 RepID=A0A2H3KGG7_9CHLR|nr:hypothetical protein [Candidatus Chloroploca asiatica]PDV96799.1 hypothetical protein A9Q02_06140 [Candidatus Chloroploca asiatica]
MPTMFTDAHMRLRFLENWLPLAQAENERNGWGYDSVTLERLILLAAPSLRAVSTLLAARALFWYYQQDLERGPHADLHGPPAAVPSGDNLACEERASDA